jgi:hypothetical protein
MRCNSRRYMRTQTGNSRRRSAKRSRRSAQKQLCRCAAATLYKMCATPAAWKSTHHVQQYSERATVPGLGLRAGRFLSGSLIPMQETSVDNRNSAWLLMSELCAGWEGA